MPTVLYQVDRNQCIAMGGMPSACANSGYGPANICVCTIPDPPPPPPAPPPAPANITVSPAIAVSPQISPNFIQQQQPQNSPVTAGTAQIGSGGATSAPASASAPAPASAPQPTTQVTPINQAGVPLPAVPVSTGPSWSSGDAVGGASIPVSYPVGQNTSAAASTSQSSNTLLYLGLGGAALLMLFLSKRRRV